LQLRGSPLDLEVVQVYLNDPGLAREFKLSNSHLLNLQKTSRPLQLPKQLHTINTMSGPKIPTKQWAQIIDKVGGPVQYKQIDVPKPGPTDVLVNIKYSGVCHTDLHAVNGDWPIPTKLPLVGGHEGAGIVVARGELVTDEDAKIGEAVGVKWLNDSCLSCTFCQQADEPLCLKPKLSGYLVDGTFQQYCVAGAKHVARIPDGIPLDEVAPILCAGITVYKGLKESGTRPGQTVAIVGAGGGLGSLAQQYAKAMGLQVIAIDTGKEKEEMSMKMGASVSFELFVIAPTSLQLIWDIVRHSSTLPSHRTSSRTFARPPRMA
jgi:alcohol dehydrogenase, propanol-preferring